MPTTNTTKDHSACDNGMYMIGLLSIIAIGFFLGMRHATDPDHVIAISTIVTQQRKPGRAALIGVFWGLGHTLTIFLVGSAIILFDVVIPTRLGLTMELSVGVMLILLGGWNLAGFMKAVPGAKADGATIHSHPHHHGELIHTHSHVHGTGEHTHSVEHTPIPALDRTLGRSAAYQFARPLLVGIVHGLAGSAAVALLILATIRNSTWAMAYLLVFGVGTIAGMMLITVSLVSTFRFVGQRFEKFGKRLALVSGLISLGFGLLLAYQICIVQGLFSGHPQWTPH